METLSLSSHVRLCVAFAPAALRLPLVFYFLNMIHDLLIDFCKIMGYYGKNITRGGVMLKKRIISGALFVVVFASACLGTGEYSKKVGYQNGYKAGVAVSYQTGYSDGETAGKKAGYDSGYSEGQIAGQKTGHDSGYAEGQIAGQKTGYDSGYAAGKSEGYSSGYAEGATAGKKAVTKSSTTSTSSSKKSTSGNSTSTTTVYITKTGNKYHRGDCSYLRQSKIAISLSEAKAEGYTPCSRCNPPS